MILFKRFRIGADSTKIDNKRFYHTAIAQYGYTPQGLHWHSRHSQEIRFKQIVSMLPSRVDSIVDAGCGFGDLCLYLRQTKFSAIRYIGLDLLDVMVEEASVRTGESIYRCDILNDPLPEGEFYVCSGALNVLTSEGALRFIERIFHASSRGVIFNFLEGEKESKTYNYISKETIQKIGEQLGATVSFREGYYESDCTAAFYKEGEA